jgi:hypothetical protein
MPENNDYEYKDVDSLNITVTAGGGGGVGSGELLPEKEWLPATIKDIRQKIDKKRDTQRLTWRFELVGDDFAYESEEDGWVQEIVLGSTSMASSPRSKLYAWYCTLMGVDSLDVGEDIHLPGLIGIACDVMVETIKDAEKPFQLVCDIRLRKPKPRRRGKPAAAQAEPVEAAEAQSPAEEPAEEQQTAAPNPDDVPF